MTNFTREQVASWQNGADGFLRWIADIRPRIPSARNGFEVFTPEPFQEEAIRGALAQKENGKPDAAVHIIKTLEKL